MATARSIICVDTNGNPFESTSTPGSLTSIPAGSIGETALGIVPVASAVPLTTSIDNQVTLIVLTPGTWQIYGTIVLTGNAATNLSYFSAQVGQFGPGTGGGSSIWQYINATPFATVAQISYAIVGFSVRLLTNTTYFLWVHPVFTVNTLSGAGNITAIRIG